MANKIIRQRHGLLIIGFLGLGAFLFLYGLALGTFSDFPTTGTIDRVKLSQAISQLPIIFLGSFILGLFSGVGFASYMILEYIKGKPPSS